MRAASVLDPPRRSSGAEAEAGEGLDHQVVASALADAAAAVSSGIALSHC